MDVVGYIRKNPEEAALVGGLSLLGLYLVFGNKDTGDKVSDYCTVTGKGKTFPPYVYASLATQLEASVWDAPLGPIVENDEDMYDVLALMKTDDDVIELACAYGERGPDGWIDSELWGKLDLVETVSLYLDDNYKEDLNELYEDLGINFRWS